MKKLLKNLLFGIAWGSTIFVISTIIVALSSKDVFIQSNEQFVKQAIGSLICGIGFYVPSVVYENDKMAMPLKILIHMGTGLIIYFIIAFNVGWVPISYGIIPMIATILILITISFLIWAMFYLYYKVEAKNINKKIKER